MYPKSIQKLIDLFSRFPTVGPRTAARFVFYLLKQSKEEMKNLISAISDLRKEIKICKFCFNPFEGEEDKSSSSPLVKTREGEGELCEICKDGSRDKTLLCVVEKETDLISLERTKKYKGRYFILGGTISLLKKRGVEKFTRLNGAEGNLTGLRIKELEERIKNQPDIQEIIIAINPTTEGEATVLYLERTLKPLGKKITRLGRGLPVGAELEYSDEETLSSALESRK